MRRLFVIFTAASMIGLSLFELTQYLDQPTVYRETGTGAVIACQTADMPAPVAVSSPICRTVLSDRYDVVMVSTGWTP